MSARHRWIGLAMLAGLALAARVALVLALWNPDAEPRTYEHGEIAANLLAGRGFSVMFLGQEGPTSQQSPLYPALLAGLYGLFGVGSPHAVLAMQLLQCLAGTALALAVVWLSWLLLPGRPAVGWLAGLGAAVYPPHIYMVTHIQIAVWAALLLTVLTCVVLSPRFRRSFPAAILAGLLGGLLLLIEPILILALPILALAMLIVDRPAGSASADASHIHPASPRASIENRKSKIENGLRPFVFASITALLIAPWLWRNHRVHGEFVFIKSTFGYALWQGNNAISWGTDKVPKPSAEQLRQSHDGSLASIDRAMWEARYETLYIDDVLLGPTGYREFAGLSEPARARLLGGRARAYIAAHPARYVALCLGRLRYFLLWDETNPKAAHPVYRLSSIAWLALTALGLGLSRRQWRVWWPLAAMFLAVTLFHALTITSARFRIPIEPLTFVWAGWGALGIAAGMAATGRKMMDAVNRRIRRLESAAASG
jgi:hypothetical protein